VQLVEMMGGMMEGQMIETIQEMASMAAVAGMGLVWQG
jgi:hypothetical protein